MATSRCGYELSDVRKTLSTAIERRDMRTAQRWTAELMTTDAAVGSLWAALWIAWATAQGAGDPNPVIPILLQQSWQRMLVAVETAALDAQSQTEFWASFRNNIDNRREAYELTARLVNQARQTPVIWPSKELVIYDVSCMRDSPIPADADSSVVLSVWERDAESMELRLMAGRWLAALRSGELRAALSAVAWTLMPPVTQASSSGHQLKISERGPGALPAKARQSAIWFWLALGKSVLTSIRDLHRGWLTLHNAITDAFGQHWKRWTAADRMRILLAWILQIRAALHKTSVLWEAPALNILSADLDLPYKEVASELQADTMQGIKLSKKDAKVAKATKESKETKESKTTHQKNIEARLAEADSAIFAALGITDE